MRPEDLSHRVAQPRQPAAPGASKVSRILMQDGRENPLGHVISNNEVGVGSAQVLRIPFYTLPKRAITVTQLAFARKCRGKKKCAAVERILRGNSELLARRNRFVFGQRGRSPKVRNDPENMLIRMRNGVGCVWRGAGIGTRLTRTNRREKNDCETCKQNSMRQKSFPPLAHLTREKAVRMQEHKWPVRKLTK